MSINWETLILSVLSSGLISAVITAFINRSTQIKAIRESGLYTKRAEILDEMIKKMENLKVSTNGLVSIFPIVKNDENDIDKSFKMMGDLDNFSKFYGCNKHYLSKIITKEIDQLINDHFNVYLEISNNKKNTTNNIDDWMEVNKKYFSKLTEKEEKIIGEFRKIIGVK